MIPTPLENIDLAALRDLLDRGRAEDRTIEYKVKVPAGSDSEKIPLLLKPVCAFANTEGGDLLLGVTAEAGMPKTLSGVEVEDIDEALRRIDEMVRAGIEPSISTFTTRAIPLEDGKVVFVVRVERSWNAPHRVKANRAFYGRSVGGTFEFDVPQIRQRVLQSAHLSEEIQKFRERRLSLIASENAPVPMPKGALLVVHVLPVESFLGDRIISAQECDSKFFEIRPPSYNSNLAQQHGLEGMLIYVSGRDSHPAYSMIFRRGCMEFVESYGVERRGNTVPSTVYEQQTIRFVSQCTKVLASFEIGGPFYVGLSILNAKDYTLGLGQLSAFQNEHRIHPFNQNHMAFDFVEVKDINADVGRCMRPVFDHVWNAAGLLKSLNYDESGSWRADRQR
jgi:hypothetical protein